MGGGAGEEVLDGSTGRGVALGQLTLNLYKKKSLFLIFFGFPKLFKIKSSFCGPVSAVFLVVIFYCAEPGPDSNYSSRDVTRTR